jgi:hypothetical protein
MGVRVIIFAFENINYKNSECVLVALVVQHAIHMRRIFIVCPDVPYFLTLSHKRHDFQEKVIEYNILNFSTTFV